MDYQERIICVGLGYVGLTLSLAFAKIGVPVNGIENNEEHASSILNETVEIKDVGLQDLLRECLKNSRLQINAPIDNFKGTTYYVITVGTPYNENGPDLSSVIKAIYLILETAADDDCIIVRSTVSIGTTRRIQKIIEGITTKKIHVTMCPERTIEGHALTELHTLPQIISSIDLEGATLAKKIFSKLGCEIIEVESVETAEFIKLMSNTYRDLNFAFGNEMALIAEGWNIDVRDAINASNYKYPRCNIQKPGLTGGPCLEKDPMILVASASEVGVNASLTQKARELNESLPNHFINQLLINFPNSTFKNFGILGLAFKGNPQTSDTRGSMAFRIRDEILNQFPDAVIHAYDSLVRPNKDILQKFKFHSQLDTFISSSEVIIIQNNNDEMIRKFNQIYSNVDSNKIVYDFWGVIGSNELRNFYIFGEGNPK